MTLWLRNKDQYRSLYYEDGPKFENAEMIFGKKVAKMLEDGVKDPVLDRVPRYKHMEYRFQLPVNGVPFLGVADSFSKHLKKIIEYKTGKIAWNRSKVHKHDQLVIYSLLAKLKHGRVHSQTRLVWIETEYKKQMIQVGSRMLECDGELGFTGKIKVFKRNITEKERRNMACMIERVATEISEDYTKYEKIKISQPVGKVVA